MPHIAMANAHTSSQTIRNVAFRFQPRAMISRRRAASESPPAAARCSDFSCVTRVSPFTHVSGVYPRRGRCERGSGKRRPWKRARPRYCWRDNIPTFSGRPHHARRIQTRPIFIKSLGPAEHCIRIVTNNIFNVENRQALPLHARRDFRQPRLIQNPENIFLNE